MAEDVTEYLRKHIWIPILVGIVLFLIMVLVLYKLCKYCNHRARYDYTQLQEDVALPRRIELQKQAEQNSLNEAAMINCQFYLRSTGIYRMAEQLSDIGSRCNKFWFTACKISSAEEEILSLLTRSTNMILPFTSDTVKTLSQLFDSVQQHPHIQPVNYIDFLQEQNLVVMVSPFTTRGSLKDLIYQSHCLDRWEDKYTPQNKGISMAQIKCIGKRILMALLFLQNKGFPPHGHLHSGNIILDKQCSRLAGYENNLLGLPSKLQSVLKKRWKDVQDSIDSIGFGHLIFEMANGSELDTPHPQPRHISQLMDNPVKDILLFIFNEDDYPTLQEIHDHNFFADVADSAKPPKITLTSQMKALLKTVRTGKSLKVRRKSSVIQVNETQSSKSKKKPKSKPSSRRSSRASSPLLKMPTAPSTVLAPPPLAPPVGPPVPSTANIPPVTTSQSAVLGDIRKGMKLKKTVTKDKSAPRI